MNIFNPNFNSNNISNKGFNAHIDHNNLPPQIIKGTSIINLDIISLATGIKVEAVTDILYDSQKHELVGILVNKGRWFKEARIILIQDVHSISKDALIITSENVIKVAVIKVAGDVPERVAVIVNYAQTLVFHQTSYPPVFLGCKFHLFAQPILGKRTLFQKLFAGFGESFKSFLR